MTLQTEHPVILFDGVCNLCSSSVQFIIKHDRKKQFRFASLQGIFGQKVLKHFDLPANELNSFILLEDGKLYTSSGGALRVTKKLNGLFPLLYGFIIVPPFIRNAVYSYVAHNRYKWFGKKEACWLPSPELKALFLDTDV
ncbi:thiol-disulfide oxidoreductase DCC family protein [soil metagenome]